MWLRDLDRHGGVADWVGSSFGLAITIGAVLATTAFFIGMLVISKNVRRLVDLGESMAAAGGPPTPEQGAEMSSV